LMMLAKGKTRQGHLVLDEVVIPEGFQQAANYYPNYVRMARLVKGRTQLTMDQYLELVKEHEKEKAAKMRGPATMKKAVKWAMQREDGRWILGLACGHEQVHQVKPKPSRKGVRVSVVCKACSGTGVA